MVVTHGGKAYHSLPLYALLLEDMYSNGVGSHPAVPSIHNTITGTCTQDHQPS